MPYHAIPCHVSYRYPPLLPKSSSFIQAHTTWRKLESSASTTLNQKKRTSGNQEKQKINGQRWATARPFITQHPSILSTRLSLAVMSCCQTTKEPNGVCFFLMPTMDSYLLAMDLRDGFHRVCKDERKWRRAL
jgi:hypothetical protein